MYSVDIYISICTIGDLVTVLIGLWKRGSLVELRVITWVCFVFCSPVCSFKNSLFNYIYIGKRDYDNEEVI